MCVCGLLAILSRESPRNGNSIENRKDFCFFSIDKWKWIDFGFLFGKMERWDCMCRFLTDFLPKAFLFFVLLVNVIKIQKEKRKCKTDERKKAVATASSRTQYSHQYIHSCILFTIFPVIIVICYTLWI